MKTIDITFHLPENSVEIEAALKSMEMAKVLKNFLNKTYVCSDSDYSFWDRVHTELQTSLEQNGLDYLISRI